MKIVPIIFALLLVFTMMPASIIVFLVTFLFVILFVILPELVHLFLKENYGGNDV